MGTEFRWAFGRVGGAVALSLVALALAACGSADETRLTTPPPPTEAPAPVAGEAVEVATETSAPSSMLAPRFELPNARGETVSLASYVGEKNVVLVFYRGFW